MYCVFLFQGTVEEEVGEHDGEEEEVGVDGKGEGVEAEMNYYGEGDGVEEVLEGEGWMNCYGGGEGEEEGAEGEGGEENECELRKDV